MARKSKARHGRGGFSPRFPRPPVRNPQRSLAQHFRCSVLPGFRLAGDRAATSVQASARSDERRPYAEAAPINCPSEAPSSLLERWRRALCFRFGVPGFDGLDQLPNAADFPDEFPTEEFGAGFFLGEVLGIAALKLFRPYPSSPCGAFQLDTMFALLEDLAKSERTTDRARLHVIAGAVEMAMNAPSCMPALIAWLDALTNDDLHHMAMAAVQCRPCGFDFAFEGLTA